MRVQEEDEKRIVVWIPDDVLLETSSESFDRLAFAQHALALVRPRATTVAVCRGVARVHVAQGREWRGTSDTRWAILSVPPSASRRAIAVAVAGLARDARPYALDLLLGPSLAPLAPPKGR